jgi:hypothetical protein
MLRSVPTVEDAVAALAGYKGHMVEISIARASDDEGSEREQYASFAGVVDRCLPWGDVDDGQGPNHWTIVFREPGDGSTPNAGSVTIWRDGFEDIDRSGEPERIIIKQRELLLDVHAYL